MKDTTVTLVFIHSNFPTFLVKNVSSQLLASFSQLLIKYQILGEGCKVRKEDLEKVLLCLWAGETSYRVFQPSCVKKLIF